MDIYTAVQLYLKDLLVDWPDLDDLVVRALDTKPSHWRLPWIVCNAVGGDANHSIPAVAALVCIYLGIILIDDMLDADPKGQHHRWGHPITSNMASALQATGLDAIVHSPYRENTKGLILSHLNRMILLTAVGQHWDMQNPQNEEEYWAIVRAKSSPFFASCFFAGALAGGADLKKASDLEEIGGIYGEMVQIHDDIHDVMDASANPDWLQGRSPLPILFARIVAHPDRDRFIRLQLMAKDPNALCEAQHILICCGAISYAIHALLLRYEQVIRKLEKLELAERMQIVNLLTEIVAPIYRLLDGIGEQNGQRV